MKTIILHFQVANEGYEAFSVAHKNMDAIRLMSSKVPDHLKGALEILYNVSTLIIVIILR